jgi:hypothetical protein
MVDWLLWVAVTICIAVILVTPLSKLPPPMEDAALCRYNAGKQRMGRWGSQYQHLLLLQT